MLIIGVIVIIILLIFRAWFGADVLSGGDWPYLYPQAIREIIPFSSWDTLFNIGMGQSALAKIWFDSYALTIVKLAQFIPWFVFERVIWFFPYIILSFGGSILLSRRFFKNININLISGFIYSINTYILLVVSGGQVGVMIAYSFLPIVYYSLLSLLGKLSIRTSLVFSLALALLILFDLRVGYMFLMSELVILAIYILYSRKEILKKIAYSLVLPGLLTLLMHIYWIGPLILLGRNPTSEFPEIYTSKSALDFFSFAKFENTISLLHPNWPENIFGKVKFLRPEFLMVPIFAFGSLYYLIREDRHKKILFLSFIFVAIIGIFLAKGTNDPFGEVYRFMFENLPGFVMFRDPTKWYMLISISYSILIPYTLFQIIKVLKEKFKTIFLVLFVLFWTFLVREAVMGNIAGTLSGNKIPENYMMFSEMVSHDKFFYRTLWVPNYPTYAYVSSTHPAIPGVDLFGSSSALGLVNELKKPASEKILQRASVRYVIIPDDVLAQIFLTDRKFDRKLYSSVLFNLRQIKYLKEVKGYGNLKIFEVSDPKPHIFSNKEIIKNVESVSPTEYRVVLRNAKKNDLIYFSENYDKFWAMNSSVNSSPEVLSKTKKINSFKIPLNNVKLITIQYLPQKWLEKFSVISLITFFIIVILLIKTKKS